LCAIMAYNYLQEMARTDAKNERLHLRVDGAAKRRLLDASAYEHQSVSDFVLTHALTAAEQVIETHQTLKLAAADWDAFYEALASPPAPSEALREGFRRYRELTS